MDTANTKAPQEGAAFSKFSDRNFTTAAHRKKPNLVIDQGMIRLINPSNAPSGEYLRAWQMEHGIPNGTPIRIVTDAHFKDMVARAQMAGIS